MCLCMCVCVCVCVCVSVSVCESVCDKSPEGETDRAQCSQSQRKTRALKKTTQSDALFKE